MTDLGLWTPYLNEPAMPTWYRLPEAVQAECAQYTPSGTELDAMSAARFDAVRQVVIAYADASVTDLPYHGPKHFREVEAYGLAAAGEIDRLTGKAWPTAVKQALAVALRMHDCHHSGSTFRADAPGAELVYRPELGPDVATEWVSSLAVNELGRQHGFSLPSRLFQMMVVWSSTYGGQTPRGRELGIPDVHPDGVWGRLMRAADVCPPADFLEWIRGSIAVNYGEIPATTPPATWDGFLQAQIGFTGYIGHCFDQLDEAAGVPVTRELGWRDNLARLQVHLRGMADGGEAGLTRAVKAMLIARHVALT